ncbi:MAG: tRNA 2-thiouridine(34) synthase MnmA [Candidatus Omnitrophota bacterium]
MAKVLVAMSGGVDSSVAAFLLKQKGFDVIGATFDFSAFPKKSDGLKYAACFNKETVTEAKKAAAKIGIEHRVFNLGEVFVKTVIENFYKEYQRGRTPNPCVRCNRFIKFNVLLKEAKKVGIDFVSTGHYAKIQYNRKEKKFLLKKAKDRTKDQSYFLYVLKQKELEHILFPLGNLTKEKVRGIAKEAGLANYDRKDSQELCFVADEDYRKFLNNFLKPEKGNIVDIKGRVLGTHNGFFNYTIGQRKGLGLSAQRPYYTLAIDWKKNQITVGFEEELYSSTLFAKEVNFISIEKIEKPLKVKARIRHKHVEQDAVISDGDNKKITVEFSKPQRAVTPGQAVVFYQKDTVVGGGIIYGRR